MPEDRGSETHEPLLVPVFQALRSALGIQIQDLSTNNFKQRLGMETGTRKVQGQLGHRG